MFPVRCFTCGAVIGDKWEEYISRVSQGEPPGKVLDEMGIRRYCCRRMFLSHVDVSDELVKFASMAKLKMAPP